MAQQKVKITIPKGFSPSERLDIARDVITYIQERAINRNKGFNPDTGREKKFPRYSKEYAKKKGSSPGDVDLVLSAEMFNAMKMLTSTSESITVGFDAGTKENAKAEGNQKGTYGKSSPIPGKARPFLGLTQAALKEILDKYDSKD
jgi:phage gpG-like protein